MTPAPTSALLPQRLNQHNSLVFCRALKIVYIEIFIKNGCQALEKRFIPAHIQHFK